MTSAKNVLHSKNVPDDPMRDINASRVFLDKYTEALVVAAAQEYFGMEECDSVPTKHVYDTTSDPQAFVMDVIGNFVDTFALPTEEDITSESTLKCPVCGDPWKNMEDLRKHLKSKHPETNDDADGHDAVYAYSCATLSMCLIAYDFTDARQHGDGDRIILLMKYMMLYFRSAGKPKYAYQVLRHLAQVSCFLSPREAHHVKWNRFINIKGRADSNVELDRVVEHSNLVVKTHCRRLHGQIKQDTIDRVSRSCQHIDKILTRQDKVTGRKASSGKRVGVNEEDDVKTLVSHMSQEHIFRVVSHGRYHKTFPGFTRGYVISVEHRDLHAWMKRTLNTLSRKRMFKALQS